MKLAGNNNIVDIMKTPILVQTPMKAISKVLSSLPFVGFCFAVMWSLMFDFDASVRTHCGVSSHSILLLALLHSILLLGFN